ncbi:MAG: AsmA family protein [Methylophilaceae bacterium]
MNKYLKYAAIAIGSFIVILLLIMAYFAATFNPNDYKQQVIDLVKEKKERTLTIDGDISLSFWPKLGANLGKVSISEHQSDKEFAAINSAKVALAVLPLLKKSLVVDTIYIDGAKANIVKYKDGTTNYDDLMSKDESEPSDIKFDVQGVNITDSSVNYTDEAQAANYQISEFNMEAGHIALGEPFDLNTSFHIQANKPVISVDTIVKGNFLYDPDSKRFKVAGLDSSIQGDLLNGKNIDIQATGDIDAQTESKEFLVDDLKFALTGDFDGVKQSVNLAAPAISIEKDNVSSNKVTVSLVQNKADGDLKVNMVLADMKGSPKAIQSSGITGDLSIEQGNRKVTGEFSSPFTGNIDALIFDIPKLVGKVNIKDPSLPNGAMQGTFNLSTHADINNELADSKFDLVFADTKLNGDVAVKSFKQPNVKFNLNADTLDLNKLLGAPQKTKKDSEAKASKPADLSALKSLLLDGKININSILYDRHRISGLNLALTADGKKLAVNGLNVKVNESQVKGALSISQFANPLYTFDLDIDQLNLNDYISEAPADTKSTGDEVIDLTALKALNANGSIRIGKLNYGKTKVSNVRIDLKADDGVATLSPLSANLYNGTMKGSLRLDARTTPDIAFKQTMTSISIGPLLQDSINNDMLSGTGTLNVDVNTKGNTVNTFKKNLAGTSSLALADGAIKGIDIAGQIRGIKNKVNMLKGEAAETDSDDTKKTDFSELTASFTIKDGIAHNEDLAMKAPVLRLAKGDSRGDINIGAETINYTATPTIVKSIKGQGGENLDELAGIAIPLKISGTFTNPKFGLDTKAIATGLAKAKVLEKAGGEKGAAVQELLEGDNKVDALKGLLDKKKKGAETESTSNADSADDAAKPATESAAEEKPKSVEDKAKEGLKDLLKF